jgi:hypothetical protein
LPSSAISRAGFAQGFSDVVAVTVKDAFVADTLLNEWVGGVGGLDQGPVGARPPIDVPAGEQYREGRIFRSEVSHEIPAALPHIVVSVFTRESPGEVGGFVGDLQIALLFVAEVHHRKLADDEPSLDGLLHHAEMLLKDRRHALLCENAYGGSALVKRLVTFSENGVGFEPGDNKTTIKKFQALISYETTQSQWAAVPTRV